MQGEKLMGDDGGKRAPKLELFHFVKLLAPDKDISHWGQT